MFPATIHIRKRVNRLGNKIGELVPCLLHLRRSDVCVLAKSLCNTLLFLHIISFHDRYVLLFPVLTARS